MSGYLGLREEARLGAQLAARIARLFYASLPSRRASAVDSRTALPETGRPKRLRN